MASGYPSALDTLSTAKQDDTNAKTGADEGTSTTVGDHAQHHDDLADAVNKIEAELGTLPKGAFASVKERLEAGDWKQSCRASTTAALPAATYANGPPATLTGNANGALAAQDGVTLVAGDRLFVKDQAAPAQNGIYEVTQVGTVGTPFILTRPKDADTAVKLSDAQYVGVQQGALNRDSTWEIVTDNPLTLGTTALRYTRNHPAYKEPRASGPVGRMWLPATAKMENMDRADSAFANAAVFATGVLRVWPLGMQRAGDTLSGLWVTSATTAAVTPTNYWACLIRVSDRQIMAVSADKTTTAWAANTGKQFDFVTPYTADKDEQMWVGMMVAAATVPSLAGITNTSNGAIAILGSPTISGSSNTGLTTPLAVGTIINALGAAAASIPYTYAT